MSTEMHKKKQIRTSKEQYTRTDSEVVDQLTKNGKTTGQSVQKACQSSVFHRNHEAISTHEEPFTSGEVSSKKLNIAAMLEATYNQIYQEDRRPHGSSRRSITLDEYDQQFPMTAKAFADQMFMDRKFMSKEGASSESRPFSDALEILNSNKDLVIKLLRDPNSLLAKYIKTLKHPRIEREMIQSILNVKFSKHGNKVIRSSENPECTMTIQKKSLAPQPLKKVVALKPTPKNTKYAENVACHCSFLQSHHRSSSKLPIVKPTPFSFSEMKRKLKYSLGHTRKGPCRTLLDATALKLSHSKLTSGDEVTCRGTDTGNSANSSTSAKDKIYKKQDLEFGCGPDISFMTETVSKKLNLSSLSFPRKQEFDIMLEAKRRLPARLKNLNEIETSTSNKSPKTLGRILLSPEHDIWLLSPRREKEQSSVSAQMRFSPYSNSPAASKRNCEMQKGKQKTCASPLRLNEQVTSSVDFRKHDVMPEVFNTNANVSLIQRADTELHENNGFAMDDLKANGRAKIEEINSILQPRNISTSEVPSDLNTTDAPSIVQKTETIESIEDDGNSMHSRLYPSLRNENFTSVLDDSPWTPLSVSQTDSTKDREEHPSPISVLDPFFTEDVNSPPSIILQTGAHTLQPIRLDYEECLFETSTLDPKVNLRTCKDDKDCISCYVHSILQASRLNWDELSAIAPLPEELIHGSFFDEVELVLPDSHCDPKLLFDHINEVLVEVYRRHFELCPWMQFIKPKIQFVPLEEHVVVEVMKEADFHLLPRTEKRTLDQLVGKDAAKSGPCLDIRLDTEEIVNQISDHVLEESVVDLILEYHTRIYSSS